MIKFKKIKKQPEFIEKIIIKNSITIKEIKEIFYKYDAKNIIISIGRNEFSSGNLYGEAKVNNNYSVSIDFEEIKKGKIQ